MPRSRRERRAHHGIASYYYAQPKDKIEYDTHFICLQIATQRNLHNEGSQYGRERAAGLAQRKGTVVLDLFMSLAIAH